MARVDYMSIILKRNDSSFFGGEVVEGSLAIMVRQRFKTTGVFLIAEGDGKVLISESVAKGIVNHSRNEKYFHFRFNLIVMKTKEFFLEPGYYSQPFAVPLPKNLPASYKCDEASITYSLTGVIKIPGEFHKVVCKPFTVRRIVDLNLIDGLREPVDLCDKTLINRFCYKSGPISVILRLKKTGFVCGENLTAQVCIENRSPRDVNEPMLFLYERVKLLASTKSKVAKRAVISTSFEKKISSGSSESFKDVGFQIPTVCATSPDSDEMLQIKYFLLLRVEAHKAPEKIEMVVPITIGAIPLREKVIMQESSRVHFKEQRARVDFQPATQTTSTFRC